MIYLIFSYEYGYNGSTSLHFHAACEDMDIVKKWCYKENKTLVELSKIKVGTSEVFVQSTELFCNISIKNMENKAPKFMGKDLTLNSSMPFGKYKGKILKDCIDNNVNYMRYMIRVCNLKVDETTMKYFEAKIYQKASSIPHEF